MKEEYRRVPIKQAKDIMDRGGWVRDPKGSSDNYARRATEDELYRFVWEEDYNWKGYTFVDTYTEPLNAYLHDVKEVEVIKEPDTPARHILPRTAEDNELKELQETNKILKEQNEYLISKLGDENIQVDSHGRVLTSVSDDAKYHLVYCDDGTPSHKEFDTREELDRFVTEFWMEKGPQSGSWLDFIFHGVLESSSYNGE